MALESVSNVKHVPSHFNVKNGDVCLNSGQLERHSEEEGEDLEDGEILDDEDQGTVEVSSIPPRKVFQLPTQPDNVATDIKKSSDSSKAHSSKESNSDSRKGRRKGDDNETHSKRRKHRKKRHNETEDEAARNGKRSKHSRSKSPRSDKNVKPEGQELEDEDDDEMLFVRGASPTLRQSSPSQARFSEYGGESEEDKSDSAENESRFHSNRGSKRKGRGTSKGASDRGKARKDRGRNSRTGTKKVSTRKKENCIFYMNGKCHKGDDCTYLHSGAPQRKYEVCKFYVMNCCMKQEKCLYMHSDFPCKYFHTGLNCDRETCLFSHEPLTETTRGILRKHIETAPKDILGSFPISTRDNTGEVIISERGDGSKSSSQDKKIPSLFDIKIEPPIMAISGNLEENEAEGRGRSPVNRRGIGFYAESRDDDSDAEDDFDTQLRKFKEAQRIDRALKTQGRRMSETEDAQLSIDLDNLREEIPADSIMVEASAHSSFSEMPSDFALHPVTYIQNLVRPHHSSQTPPRPSFSQSTPGSSSFTPPRPNFYQDTSERLQQQERQIQSQLMHTEDEDSDDEGQLVMATQEYDEEMPSQHTASDTGEEDLEDGVPKQLPKKQRELFLRIQQQQAQRAAAKAAEEAEAVRARQELEARSAANDAEKSFSDDEEQRRGVSHQQEEEDEEEEEESDLDDIDEDWYSSDDEAEEKNLTDILKNMSKQPTTPTVSISFPSPKLAPVIEDTKSSPNSTLDNVNLSQINISPDITKLLSSMRSKAEEVTSKSTQQSAPRDPRISRDPRNRNTEGITETKVPPVTNPLQSIGDIDLRMLPGSNKDLDLRPRPSSSLTDIDLRKSCFGDTDLRDISLLGLPFKPAPLHVPCKEIDASISSHPPVEYKVLPVEIRPPQYSNVKINLSDPHVRGDPRLKKVIAKLEATISPMSPPPVETITNVDPRMRSDPRTSDARTGDPRLARLANTNPPIIPVNSVMPPQIPQMPIDSSIPGAFPPMLNPLGGILEITGRPGDGLLGPVPVAVQVPVPSHVLGIMSDAQMQRPALLATPPVQHPIVEDFDLRQNFPAFRGHRGSGTWERRGGRRGRGNWDRDQSTRRARRDFDDRSPNQDFSPPRHNRSPPRQHSRSPVRDKRRRSSPTHDTLPLSPGRRHSKHSPRHHASYTPPRGEAGSFTPPRSSFTPPRDN